MTPPPMNDVKVITEPSVYIVGRQTVLDDELDRFLSDHGVTWESDSEVAAELLPAADGFRIAAAADGFDDVFKHPFDAAVLAERIRPVAAETAGAA